MYKFFSDFKGEEGVEWGRVLSYLSNKINDPVSDTSIELRRDRHFEVKVKNRPRQLSKKFYIDLILMNSEHSDGKTQVRDIKELTVRVLDLFIDLILYTSTYIHFSISYIKIN